LGNDDQVLDWHGACIDLSVKQQNLAAAADQNAAYQGTWGCGPEEQDGAQGQPHRGARAHDQPRQVAVRSRVEQSSPWSETVGLRTRCATAGWRRTTGGRSWLPRRFARPSWSVPPTWGVIPSRLG